MRVGIGLDFGTTNSSVAIARSTGPTESLLFQTSEGPTDTYRSVLYFERKAAACSGPSAIDSYLAAPEKGRLIQSLKSFLASRLFTGTSVFGRHYTIEDLVTIILRGLWSEASSKLGSISSPVAVGRPVRFANATSEEDNEFALKRLRKAFEQAEIGPIVFEYEPVAAAYFYEKKLDHDELIMIADFGGGTSDFSLLEVGPSVRNDGDRRILGTEGVALAGDAFDGRIVQNLVSPALGKDAQYESLGKILPIPLWIYSELERWHYLSFLNSDRTLRMLRGIQSKSDQPKRIASLLHVIEDDLGFNLHQSVQKTKTALSSNEASHTFFFEDYETRVEAPVRRRDFEQWIEEDLQKIRSCVGRLLSDSGVGSSGVDRVFLTGGSSLVPVVRRIFVQEFGEAKISGGSEFTSVARGLASRALREPFEP